MAHAHKGGISHSPGQQFAAPKQRYAPPGATIRPRTDESNRVESTRASSNSAAENAARGPHCSVFFPGCQKTRLWGLSKRLEAARKARKGAAKREKRQESRQWGPERHAEAMQRGPLAAFPAIPRAKPCNRRFPAKKKPAKRYEHLAGFDPNQPRTASSLPAAALRRG